MAFALSFVFLVVTLNVVYRRYATRRYNPPDGPEMPRHLEGNLAR